MFEGTKIGEETFKGVKFSIYRIHSDNPGLDGFLTVSHAPENYNINGQLFLDREEIINTLEDR